MVTVREIDHGANAVVDSFRDHPRWFPHGQAARKAAAARYLRLQFSTPGAF
jgi:hypothetical protein